MHHSAPQIVTEVQAAELETTLNRNAWYSPLSFQIATWLVGHLPRPATRSISVTGAELGYRLCRERRRALMSNMEVIESNEIYRKRLARTCFHSFLRMLHDFCDCAAGGSARVNALMY